MLSFTGLSRYQPRLFHVYILLHLTQGKETRPGEDRSEPGALSDPGSDLSSPGGSELCDNGAIIDLMLCECMFNLAQIGSSMAGIEDTTCFVEIVEAALMSHRIW